MVCSFFLSVHDFFNFSIFLTSFRNPTEKYEKFPSKARHFPDFPPGTNGIFNSSLHISLSSLLTRASTLTSITVFYKD